MHYLTGYDEGKSRPREAFFQLLAVVLAAGLLFSCSSGSSSTTTTPTATFEGELVTSTPAGSLDAAGLTAAVVSLGLTGVTVRSGATCYKLTYGTPDVSGNIINASGLVCLPSAGTGSRPVISYQHGTIFQDSEAPSSFITSGEAALGAVFAGLGYIAVLPDYIGYGDSTALLHPYVHAATLASATVNMNRAARTCLASPNINRARNGQFFLTGYAEGGYATLATQRLMEQSLTQEFPVTASEAGAGPYDMSTTTLAILSSPTQSQPGFAGFFFKAYDTIYNTPSQIQNYFVGPKVNIVNTYFDGSKTRSEIRDALGGAGVATNALFNQTFLDSYLGTGETALKARIVENDIYDWAPQVPTRLFHSETDDTVPYANTTKAKTAMDLRSAPSVTVVNCITIAVPADHTNCARPFAADMIIFFNSLATDL